MSPEDGELSSASKAEKNPEEVLKSLPAEEALSDEQLNTLGDALTAHMTEDNKILEDWTARYPGGAINLSAAELRAFDDKILARRTVFDAIIQRWNKEIHRRDAEKNA